MLRRDLLPEVHLFVCANRRDSKSPLGAGCGERGDEVFEAMKQEVARRGAYRSIWVTRTHCLGVCPKRGTTVAVYAEYPSRAIFSEVETIDAVPLLAAAVDGRVK